MKEKKKDFRGIQRRISLRLPKQENISYKDIKISTINDKTDKYDHS